MGRQIELIFEDEEANPVGRGAEGREAVPGRQGRFPHRHRQLRLDARGRPARRTRRQADRHDGFVRRLDHRRQMLAQRVPRQRPRRASNRRRSRSGWPRRSRRPRCSISAPTTRWAARPSRPSSRAPRRSAPASVGEVFAPLDSKDYTQYFGQLRAARPQVLYTSVAGNDTVRLLTPAAGFRPAQQPDRRRRVRHRHVAEHRRDRQGGRGLRHRRRLFDRDRHAREQEVRRRRSRPPTRPIPTSTAPTPTA